MAKQKEAVNIPEAEEGGETNTDPAREKEVLEGEVKARGEKIVKLEQSLAEKDGEIAALTEALNEARQAVEELGKAVDQAVAAYRDTVVEANPGLLPEMITGDSIDEINESVKKARAVVERVRQEMEAEAARTKIPAGAPPRSRPDLSALTAREKIQYAIRGSST
jgi:uncharacterized coiled-coil protein SlyX